MLVVAVAWATTSPGSSLPASSSIAAPARVADAGAAPGKVAWLTTVVTVTERTVGLALRLTLLLAVDHTP